MATYNAIAAVTHGLLAVLRDACPRTDFPDAQFEPLQITGEPPALGEAVTLLLYRVGLNGRRAVHYPPRPDGQRPRPAIAVDLFYLLSVWGRSVEQQQRLFAWSVRELATRATLPVGRLNEYHLGPQDTFTSGEDLEVVCEPLSLQDLALLWDVMKPQVPLSMGYVVHMVPIDGDLVTTGGPVQTRVFDMKVPSI
jgi:hypothetical protein